MTEIENTKGIGEELTRIFNRFNDHFYNGELPEVIITFKPTKSTYGHISFSPVWESDSSEAKYELNISAYTMDRSQRELCETLLHEQVHLYCIIHNIKDCSNQGRYHNKHFKKICEDHGLNCQRHPIYGWSITTFNDDALKFFNKLKIKHIAYRYAAAPQPGTLRRYVCPRCLITKAYVSSKQNLLCGYCNVQLEYAPTRKNG